jgi:hypothetical protein
VLRINCILSDAFNIITLNVWLRYASLSFTQHGVSEISTCVKVGIEIRQTTMETRKGTTGTRTKMSTSMTYLGRIVRFDLLEGHTLSFSLILDKGLQLKEAPIADPIVHSLSSISFPDTFEVFHYNLLTVETFNNVSTDIVVYPSHPTSFSSAKLLEKPFCRTSAFALKLGTQIPVFTFDLFNFIRLIEPAIRCDCKSVYSEIDAENSVLRTVVLDGIDLSREREKEKASTFFINPEQRFTYLPGEIILVTIRDLEFELLSGFEKSQIQDITLDSGTSREIISYTCMIDQRFRFSFLDNTASLFETCDSELRWNFEFSPDSFVYDFMEFDIILDFMFPRMVNTELQRSTVCFYSSDYLFGWSYLDLSGCYSSHNYSKYGLLYKINEMEEKEIELQRRNSSPHLNAVSPCYKS